MKKGHVIGVSNSSEKKEKKVIGEEELNRDITAATAPQRNGLKKERSLSLKGASFDRVIGILSTS